MREGASEAEEEARGEVAWAKEIGFANCGWAVVEGVGVGAAVEEIAGGNVYLPAPFQAARQLGIGQEELLAESVGDFIAIVLGREADAPHAMRDEV